MLGCAQTGTGKTASFALPMIDMLAAGRARARMPRSLILEPTRELATQVAASFEIYGKYHQLTMALLIGGESFVDQERKLDRGVDVLIATPGRLARSVRARQDHAVRRSHPGDRRSRPDARHGLHPRCRAHRRAAAEEPADPVLLGDDAARNPPARRRLPHQPGRDLGGAAGLAGGTVVQSLAVVDPRDKREALRRLIGSEDVKNALIFCNRKRDVDILYKSLSQHGFDAAALHGDMPQPKRTETLERFKNGEIRLLVAATSRRAASTSRA